MTSTSREYVSSLDGLRAFAIIAVLAVHAGVPGFSLGWLGVDLFFALSGFLITTLLVKEYDRTGKVDILKFWGRRFLRLFPAYYLYLTGLILLIVVGKYPLTSSGDWTPSAYLASLGFYFNNFLPRGGFWAFDWLTIHIWSLALEEQFYLIWPTLFVFAIQMRRSVLLPLAMIATILVCRPFISDFAIASLPHGRGLAIVVGCAVALLARDLQQKAGLPGWLTSSQVRLGWVVSTIGLAIVLLVAHELKLLDEATIKRWFVPVFSLQFSLIVAMFWYGPKDWLSRSLSVAPLSYIGQISYGVYLYHMLAHYLTWKVLLSQIDSWPSIPKMGLRLVMYSLLSVGIAALSYHFYEKPFLQLKQKMH